MIDPKGRAAGQEAVRPAAPSYASLPDVRHRAQRGGVMRTSIEIPIAIVTPVLGGGARTRAVDDIDLVRPATVRGHFRFWWRALYGHEFSSSDELHRAESELWGQAATDGKGRSAVEVRINIELQGPLDESEVLRHPGAYALWPARAGKQETQDVPRRSPGTRFRLILVAPLERDSIVRNVVRAWVLFGGYGSRTRRGLGSLNLLQDPKAWLPNAGTRASIHACFDRDIFAPVVAAVDTPWLAGASLHVGPPRPDATTAWIEALNWLKEFRQGTRGEHGDRAREPGKGKRPSISNWPEADKIRHLANETTGHRPKHNKTPAWPRAGFGLPIVGQFQTHGGSIREPDPFDLRWRTQSGKLQDRLASPLIVKAMPLADGKFLPCALWLNRSYPRDAVVVEKTLNDSAAPFDQLVAPNDTSRFKALEGKRSLREAFLEWLRTKHDTKVIAP